MTRIFTTLAWFAVLCVAANLVIGLMMGDLRDHPSQEVLTWATIHRLGGLGAALAVVFVNSVVIPYFVGTSRWCKEVSETYHLEPKFVAESTRIKRRTFPWAVISMLAVISLGALGAAADPSSGQPNTQVWTTPHLVGAFLVLCFLAWASVVEWNNIHANHEVIEQVLAAVKKIRTERGLDA